MHLRRLGRQALLLALAAAWASTPIHAQPLGIPQFEFELSNPGARSLGFGGAFAALADDATAAYANPAGLTQLAEIEVSVEGRLWSRSNQFPAGGRIEGTPTGIGIDTESDIRIGSDPNEIAGLYFASVVIPRERFSLALYGHQLASFKLNTESQGLFIDDFLFDGITFRFPATREEIRFDIVTMGLSAGFRVNDRLSLGLGLVHTRADATSTTDSYFFDFDRPESLFEVIPFTPERLLSTSRLAIDGSDWTLNAGLLWSPWERVTLALFHRQGAEIEGVFELSTREGDSTDGIGILEVPSVTGVGVVHRALGGALTTSLEIDYVGYEGLLRIVLPDGDDGGARAYLDGWEVHLGAEYALLSTTPIVALRVGGYVEENGVDFVDPQATHFAIGVGIATKAYQIDLAGDFSSESNTLSVSFIYKL